MATLSARAQLLRDARNSELSRIGSVIKIPSSATQASTIAKQAATAELQTKTDQYNQGLLSNEDMLAYLKSIQNNPTFSLTERGQVQKTINDFNDKINEGKLQAAYQNTAPGTINRYQAAQALADFYNNQASRMADGSPAQSTALGNAGQWTQQANAEQETLKKQNRSLQRAQLFNNIARTTDPNSIQNAQATADAYTKLANEAAADGDQTQAYQFATEAQNALNRIPTIQDQEQKKVDAQNKTILMNYINSTYNDYQDGKISGDQALANLQAADEKAAEIGDTSVQLHLNSIATTIQRNEDKGVYFNNNGSFGSKSGSGRSAGSGEIYYDPTTGTISASSAPSSSASRVSSANVNNKTITSGVKPTQLTTPTSTKAPGGIASPKTQKAAATLGLPAQGGVAAGGPMSLSEMDRFYQDQLKQASDWLLAGKAPNGQPFMAADYMKTIQALTNDRVNELNNINAQLSQIDPNIKIKYGDTTTTVGKQLDNYNQEFTVVQAEAGQFANGDLIPVMRTSPDSKTGIPMPSIKLEPVSSLPNFKQDYLLDSSGIAHQISYARQYLTPQQALEASAKGQVVQHDGPNAYTTGSPYVDVYDTAGRRIRYQYDPKYGFLPDASSIADPTLAQEYKNYALTIQKETDAALAQGKPAPNYAPLNYQQFQNLADSGELGRRMYGEIYNPQATQPKPTAQQSTLPPVTLPQVVAPLNQQGPNPQRPNIPGVTSTPMVIAPLPRIMPTSVQTSQPFTPVQAQSIPDRPIGNLPGSNPSGNLTQTIRSIQTQPIKQLSVAGAQPSAPVNNSGVKLNLGAPPSNNAINNIPAVPKPQPQQPSLWDNITKGVQSLGSKVGSFFGGLF